MAQTTFRTYELVIGRPVYIGEKPTNIDKYTPTNKGGQTYRIVGDGSREDLNIQFEVKKDNSKEPNKGYVTVCNLSDDTVNYLDANQRESLAVMLYAGYNNQNMLIFSGTVEFMENTWDGPTRKTKFILGDGTLNLTTSRSTRSYKKGTPVDSIVNDLITDLKLPKGRVVPFGKGEVIQHSMAFSGTASQSLDTLARNTNSTFSVQDGAVYWTKVGSRFKDAIAEISEDTGMKGSPVPKNPEPARKRLAKRAGKKTPAKPHVPTSAEIREDAGMEVTSLLNGSILPESSIYLKSKEYTGFYKVIYLTHKGDLTGDWETVMGVSEVRGKLIE